MNFDLSKVFPSVPRPKPISVPMVQETASDIVSKASLIENIRDLPDGGYAILVTMQPGEAGDMMIRDRAYPPNRDTVVYHGLYNYVAEYMHRRVNGNLSEE